MHDKKEHEGKRVIAHAQYRELLPVLKHHILQANFKLLKKRGLLEILLTVSRFDEICFQYT